MGAAQSQLGSTFVPGFYNFTATDVTVMVEPPKTNVSPCADTPAMSSASLRVCYAADSCHLI